MSEIVRGDSASPAAPLRHASRKDFPDLSFRASLRAGSPRPWPAWTRRIAFAAAVAAMRWPAWTDRLVASTSSADDAHCPGPLFRKRGGAA